MMENLRRLLPHTKKESKMDKRDKLIAINEIAEMKNCNKTLFFEGRKQGDIYLWMSCIPEGPSVKFLMENSTWRFCFMIFPIHLNFFLIEFFCFLCSFYNGRAEVHWKLS